MFCPNCGKELNGNVCPNCSGKNKESTNSVMPSLSGGNKPSIYNTVTNTYLPLNTDSQTSHSSPANIMSVLLYVFGAIAALLGIGFCGDNYNLYANNTVPFIGLAMGIGIGILFAALGEIIRQLHKLNQK